MDPELIPVTVKLPKPIAERVKLAAKKQGKKLQSYYAELLAVALGRAK
jgi:hypothetical protein